MRNCPVCGPDVPDTARFCRHCGHTLSTPTPIDDATDMKNFPVVDGQPMDVSSVPTRSLTNSNKKERAQVGLPDGFTSSEKQLATSNQYSSGEDNDEQVKRASLADIPTMDVALSSGSDMPSGRDASMAQETVHISE